MIVKRLTIVIFLAICAVGLLGTLDTLANQGRVMKGLFETLFSDKAIQPIALGDVKRKKRPPSYFAADPEQTDQKTNARALRFAAATPQTLEVALRSILIDDLGAIERSQDGNLLFIDRTPLMRFPDGLYGWIDQRGEQTRLALFSTSVYAGNKDFGVNQRRVEYIVQELSKRFPAQSPK